MANVIQKRFQIIFGANQTESHTFTAIYSYQQFLFQLKNLILQLNIFGVLLNWLKPNNSRQEHFSFVKFKIETFNLKFLTEKSQLAGISHVKNVDNASIS